MYNNKIVLSEMEQIQKAKVLGHLQGRDKTVYDQYILFNFSYALDEEFMNTNDVYVEDNDGHI